MARIGLQHRGAQLDRRGFAAGERDADERIAADDAGVPE